MPISIAPLKSTAPSQTKENKPAKDNTAPQKISTSISSKISVRDGVIITAVPTLLGAGYSAKSYFERKGKYSVYNDLAAKYSQGTPEHGSLTDCAKLMKKGMRDAKICGILIAAAGIIAAGTFAVIKAVQTGKKQQKTPEKLSNIQISDKNTGKAN